MQRTRRSLYTLLVPTLIAAAGGTYAGDAVKYFDGIYVGGETGVAIEGGLRKDIWYNANDTNFYYGGLLGYRYQFDNGFVLGIEGTVGDATYNNKVRPIEDRGTHFFLQADGVDNNWVGDYKSDLTWGTSLTVGTVLGSSRKSLLYVSGGYIKSNNATAFPDGRDVSNLFIKEDDDGWRVGVGYEWAFRQNLSVRLSTHYVDFGDYLPPIDNLVRFDGFINRRVNGAEQYQGRLALIASF